jgi:endonuclease YncB( thermonuclease family)
MRELASLSTKIALSVLWAFVLVGSPRAGTLSGVPEVLDADTVRFCGTKVRLLDMDAPETD